MVYMALADMWHRGSECYRDEVALGQAAREASVS